MRSTLHGLLLLPLAMTSVHADACTRALWNAHEGTVLVGRTMDWAESTAPMLVAFPAGRARDGGKIGKEIAVPDNPLRWTSKYGSLVTTAYGMGAVDGVNERGLAAHLLYLVATDFGPRDAKKPGAQAGLWAQYALDNAASVKEALDLLSKVQPVMVEAEGHKATVHLALEDASGDSAIIEYIKGKPVVHHGREFTVMTNDPTYDEQLALLKQKDFSKPDSDLPLPGNVNPRDRFQRATYFLNTLPKPVNASESAANVFSIMRNVSVPFGAPYKQSGIYNTEYRTVIDLKDKRYFFELSTMPSVIWVDIDKLALKKGARVAFLDPNDMKLAGDVSGKFQDIDPKKTFAKRGMPAY